MSLLFNKDAQGIKATIVVPMRVDVAAGALPGTPHGLVGTRDALGRTRLFVLVQIGQRHELRARGVATGHGCHGGLQMFFQGGLAVKEVVVVVGGLLTEGALVAL